MPVPIASVFNLYLKLILAQIGSMPEHTGEASWQNISFILLFSQFRQNKYFQYQISIYPKYENELHHIVYDISLCLFYNANRFDSTWVRP